MSLQRRDFIAGVVLSVWLLLLWWWADSMVWVRPAVKGMLPEGRAAHTCTLVDNRLVVFGGNDRSQLHSSVWILDIGKFCLFVLAALPGRVCVLHLH